MTADRSPMSMPISSVGVAVSTFGASGAVPVLERGFEVFSCLPAEHAGVFPGDDASGRSAAVEVAVVVGRRGDAGSVGAGASERRHGVPIQLSNCSGVA